jgi:hypothetical protein
MRLLPLLLLATTLAAAAPAHGATFIAPVQPPTIEPGCDYGDTECLDPGRRHAGVDYLPDDEEEPVLASADGIVRMAARADSDASHDFGNVVVLEHRLPDGSRVATVYAHLREAPSAAPGDCLARGARLGTMGRTGAAANVHLHFEVKERPVLGPPYGYTDGDPDGLGYFDPKGFVGKREAAELCEPPVPGGSACATAGPRSSLPTVAGSARELRGSGRIRRLAASCRLQVALVRRKAGRCAYWRQARRRMEWRDCASALWTNAAVRRDGEVARWSHRFRARPARGDYELSLRLVDGRGRVHVPGGVPAAVFSLPRPR